MSTDFVKTGSTPKQPWHRIPVFRYIFGILCTALILLLVTIFIFDIRFWCVTSELRAVGATVQNVPEGGYIVTPSNDKKATSVLNSTLIALTALNASVSLHMNDTDTTDEALIYLDGLKNLADLQLANTYITDAGVPHLAKIYSLKTLNLKGTKVTDEGAKALQQALPKCRIER